MPIEKYTCSVSLNDETVIESTPIHVHGHPGITEWGGTLGPTETELEVGWTYKIMISDGREGLIIIKGALKAWGGVVGQRYEFTGGGFIA